MSRKNRMAISQFRNTFSPSGEFGQGTNLETLEPRLLLSAAPTPMIVTPGSWQSPAIMLQPGKPGTNIDQSRYPNVIGWDSATGTISTTTDTPETGTRFRTFDQFGGTWCDAEKQLPDSYVAPGTGDDLMCWAAAASNALQWAGWGNVSGITNSDQVFKYLQDHWTDLGNLPGTAMEYWLDGTDATATWGTSWSHIDVAGGGNFYPGVSFTSVFHSRGQGTMAQSYAMMDVEQYLRSGDGVNLGVFGGGGHAITCWGFNYDTAQTVGTAAYYKGIWVTDSDDNKNTLDATTAPDVLHYYGVQYTDGKFYLQNFYGTTGVWYIGEVDAINRYTPVPTPVDDYANAGDYANAAAINLNASGDGTISGTIEVGSDTDLFKFVAAGTGTATVKLTPSVTLNGVVTIYNATGIQLASVNLGAAGVAESISVSVTQNSTYYIQTSAYQSVTTGTYTLAVRSPLPVPADDYANAGDYAHAATIVLNTTGAGAISGVIETGTDTDLFKFVAGGSGTATIKMTPASTLDGVVTIFDATGKQLTTVNRSRAGVAESVSFTVSSGATYYVQASSYKATIGSYSLSVQAPPADDYANYPNWSAAAMLEIDAATGNGSVTGVIGTTTDTDLFKVVAPATGNTTITLTPSSGLNVVLNVYNANGTLLKSVNAASTGGKESLTLSLTAGTTYYIGVSSYRSATTGTYTLALQSPLVPVLSSDLITSV